MRFSGALSRLFYSVLVQMLECIAVEVYVQILFLSLLVLVFILNASP